MLMHKQYFSTIIIYELFFIPDWIHDKNMKADSKYWDVIWQITDQPSSRYSIHQIALKGAESGTPVGKWFGPHFISQTIRFGI